MSSIETGSKSPLHKVKNPSLEEMILSTLDMHLVPYKRWGSDGASKPYQEFLDSVNKNRVSWDETEPLTIRKDISVIYVLCEKNGCVYQLRESHRTFKHNGYKCINRNDGSIGETMLDGETSLNAAVRGLEKLGQTEPRFINEANYLLSKAEEQHDMIMQLSVAYPPLTEILDCRTFICLTPPEYFHEQYQFIESDKITVWKWVKVIKK